MKHKLTCINMKSFMIDLMNKAIYLHDYRKYLNLFNRLLKTLINLLLYLNREVRCAP